MKEKKFLTSSEKKLMDIFWAHTKPLTSVELTTLCTDYGWIQENILNMLKNLQKKGFLTTCGTVGYHTRKARSFKPTFSKEDYAAQLALSTGIGIDSFAETALAMAAYLGDKDEIIRELEQMIDELKEKTDV